MIEIIFLGLAIPSMAKKMLDYFYKWRKGGHTPPPAFIKLCAIREPVNMRRHPILVHSDEEQFVTSGFGLMKTCRYWLEQAPDQTDLE